MLSALVLALSLSAPATVPTASMAHESVAPISTQHLQVDPNSPDREASFVDRYLSFQLSPMASQQAKDGLILSHVIGYLAYGLCGTLWGPIVAVPDAEFTGEIALTWLVSNILWYVITVAAATVTLGVGAVMIFALPYLSTTSVLNEVDRGIKKRGLAKGAKPTPGAVPTPGAPPTPGETPPPSYAY